jgi:hypothetical protein
MQEQKQRVKAHTSSTSARLFDQGYSLEALLKKRRQEMLFIGLKTGILTISFQPHLSIS